MCMLRILSYIEVIKRVLWRLIELKKENEIRYPRDSNLIESQSFNRGGWFFMAYLEQEFFNTKIISITSLENLKLSSEILTKATINSKDFMFDFEFVSKVLKKNIWKISEVDISYKGRTFKEGKKISWLDGFRALLVILKVKLFY